MSQRTAVVVAAVTAVVVAGVGLVAVRSTDAASAPVPAASTAPPAPPAGGGSGLDDLDARLAPPAALDAAELVAPPEAGRPALPKASGRQPVPAVAGTAVAANVTGPAVDLHDGPGGQVVTTLANPRETGAPLVLQVVADHGDWLAVHAPTRPNGFVGWIRADGLTFSSTDVRIVVDVGDRTLSIWQGEVLLGTIPGAVGRPSTPTPLGTFYVTEVHDLRAVQSVYGTFALGLSAFSETLTTFNGGDAQTAIHGTWSPDTVGRVTSNGCVRLYNDDVEWLASVAPVGTTVEVVA